MSNTLLSTKLYIPPARPNAITRPRLMEKLMASLSQPGSFVLLSGPAGFGKTTLLSEFVARLQLPVAWISLDEGDNDPVRFWSYVIAACQAIHPSAGASAQILLQSAQPLPVETIPTILINDLASQEQELMLVLDDYHFIQDASIHVAISFLLEHLPRKLHILISTRVDPPWPLARFRARNQLVEIRAQDLRFTTEEAARFLKQVMGVDLNADEIAALEERTEGWIAGLQLAALSMEGRNDTSRFVQAFTGSHSYVAEYLLEEILQRQTEEMQTFLLQTSVLERMNPELCEAVTGYENGQAMLMALHRANLFVISLDDNGWWYRYHQLFADLLRARLRQEWPADAIALLHRRAAKWYDQVGMTQEAIEHALTSADYSHALQLVEKIVLPMVLKAYFKTVEDWVQAIPSEYMSENLRVNMALARMQLMRHNLVQATPYVDRLQKMINPYSQNMADKNHQPGEEHHIEPALQGEWLALQAMLMNAQGKAFESIDLAEQALKILPEAETQIRSITYMGLAAAYQQTLDYERAAEACQQIIQQSRAAGDLPSELFGLSYLGLMVLQQGKLRCAYETASDALQRIERTGSFFPFSATLYGELAQVYYHWHQLEKARNHFSRSVELSTLGGFSDAEIYHAVFLSRLFQMEGDLQKSLDEVEKALDRMQAAAPALVKEEVIAQQVSILLALNRPAAAQNALISYGFSFEKGFAFPEISDGAAIPHAVGLLYISALRILINRGVARHQPDALRRGIELAGLVIDGASRCRHLPIVLKTYLLRSQMHTILGDEQAGMADLARALELGEPEGFISIFVEEGAAIAEPLKNLLKSKLAARASASYIHDILTAFPKTQSQEKYPPYKPAESDQYVSDQSSTLFEPLTAREMEVLGLIAAGNSNRAIAEKLVITVSAVKKHTGNIYGKLNVDSRTQAVALARQLGLLRKDG